MTPTTTPTPLKGTRRVPLPRGNEAERLYSVAEAAKLLGVGLNYVYDRINNGTFPTVSLSPDNPRPKRRIRASVLQEWIEANETRAA